MNLHGSQLSTVLSQVQSDLRVGRYTNEAAVSQGIVLPILQALGWPVFNTQVVAPQFAVEERWVDFALCHPERHPVIFVEVKRVGNLEGGDQQLFEYAFRFGTPMAVLTDGVEWHFYLPTGEGSYLDRRVYKLDIQSRSASESSERLIRYLAYPDVCSKKAIEAARADYSNVQQSRKVQETLPHAWEKLISEPDPLLIDLLAETVSDLCGYSPAPDVCAEFLERVRGRPAHLPVRVPTPAKRGSPEPRVRRKVRTEEGIGFVFRGKARHCRSAKEVMVEVLRSLDKEDPTFLERVVARKHGRKRRYVAKTRFDLYADRPDLAESYAEEIRPGWFVGTNYSRSQIEKIIRMACEVSGIQFGKDLQVNLGA